MHQRRALYHICPCHLARSVDSLRGHSYTQLDHFDCTCQVSNEVHLPNQLLFLYATFHQDTPHCSYVSKLYVPSQEECEKFAKKWPCEERLRGQERTGNHRRSSKGRSRLEGEKWRMAWERERERGGRERERESRMQEGKGWRGRSEKWCCSEPIHEGKTA